MEPTESIRLIQAVTKLLDVRCQNCGHKLRKHPVKTTDLECRRFTGFERDFGSGYTDLCEVIDIIEAR